MLNIKTVAALAQEIKRVKESGKTIGFVPTMGALHQGHLTLVKQAREACDYVIVSVFVNPNQFNNAEDLARYPRDLERDEALLKTVGCELLFAPNVKEVYPQEDKRIFNFGMLESVMEGKHRPGHFNGVAQVVSRLFELIPADKAFFGLKDFQQLAVIQAMVKQLKLNVEIVPCPIVREQSGLAMSSRNMLLEDLQRKNAPLIAKTLLDSCNFVAHKSVDDLKTSVIQQINAVEGLEVEYFEVVDGQTLQAIQNWDDSSYVVACIAVYAGKIRLIDNVIYKNS